MTLYCRSKIGISYGAGLVSTTVTIAALPSRPLVLARYDYFYRRLFGDSAFSIGRQSVVDRGVTNLSRPTAEKNKCLAANNSESATPENNGPHFIA